MEDYLNLFAPIGCRDDFTRDNLHLRGVDAFTSGCTSFFLPRRISCPSPGERDKVFIVDLSSKEEMEALPQNIRDRAQFLSVEETIKTFPMDELECARINTAANARLALYANQARMIITHRFHVAVPCAAMGVPVTIGIGNIGAPWYTQKFSWLHRIIPPSGPRELSQLDYEHPPKPLVDVEHLKREMMEKAKKMVLDAVKKIENGELRAMRPKILEELHKAYGWYRNRVWELSQDVLNNIRCLKAERDALSKSRWHKLGQKLRLVKSMLWKK